MERHPSANCCSVPWCRVNGKLTVHEPQPFPHAGQAQPAAVDSPLGVEACPYITDDQLDLADSTSKPALDLL